MVTAEEEAEAKYLLHLSSDQQIIKLYNQQSKMNADEKRLISEEFNRRFNETK
jgi:hypothetical protein